jgi:hypothetical protein
VPTATYNPFEYRFWDLVEWRAAMIVCKKIIFIWVIIIALVIIFFGQENNEAEKIIEKYLSASGGSAVADIKTETIKGTMLRGITGKVPLEILAKTPGKWLYHQTFAWGDQVIYGFDGTNAWVQDTQSVTKMSSRKCLDLQLLLDFQLSLKIKEYFPEMKIIGSEMVGNRESTTISAASKEGIEIELAFDNETGLLLRADEMIFEDYRDVGGIIRPFKILLGKSQEETQLQMKMEFSEIRHDIEVDDALFHQPACALSFTEAPLFKPRTQVEVSIEALEACVGKYRLQERPEVIFTVTRQKKHLMLQSPSWGGQKFEIMPESDENYFIEFLNLEFHFIKDTSGKVTHLEIKSDRTMKTEKID